MREYDAFGHDFVLYKMFTNKKNFKGEHINTDYYGYRLSKYANNFISLKSEEFKASEVNIILGASTAFGVGSTKDETTIASYLHSLSGQKWINLGVRACNSMQEIINIISVLDKVNINQVIILSGINDIYLSLNSNETESSEDSIFYNNLFAKIFEGVEHQHIGWKRKLYNKFMFKKNQKLIKDKKSLNQKVNVTELIELTIKRNFLFYSLLTNKDIKVKFFLQPFFGWIEKKNNNKENEIIKFLNKTRSISDTLDKINMKVYNDVKSIYSKYSQIYDIDFFDLNSLNTLKGDAFLFVDRVHLSDLGYKFISDFIHKQL